MIERIKKILSYILAEKENFSFEKRMFLSAILIGILTTIVGSLISAFLSIQPVSIFSGILLGCLLIIIYYFVRVKGIYKPFVIPIILLSFFAVSLIWIFGGGMNGPNMMVGYVVLILALIVISDKYKKYFLILFLTLTTFIYLIQLYKPEIITNYPSERARWGDYLITTIYSTFLIFLIIKFLHKNYTIERNRAEENEKKFRALSENSEDYITRIDSQQHHLFVNKAWLKATGLTQDQIIGKTISEIGIYNQRQNKIFEKAINNVFTTKKPQFGQHCVEGKNGLICYDWRLFPEFNEKNEVVSVLWVSRDITLLKQSENKLIKLNADKDRYMSILAHDLKNPFNTLLGFSGLLKEELHSSDMDKIEKQVSIIHNISQKTFNLLNDLLMWAKSQSGDLEFNPQKINFVKICQETIDNIRAIAQSKNISVNYISNGNISLRADENMIKVILRNLVSNAVKFTNPGGQIDIRTEETASTLTVSVSDNGVGIEQETLKNLFNISQKTTTIGTADEKGSGLGLILCKEFVEKHGGIIWVESVMGKGSDFKFTLPVYANDKHQLVN